MKANGNSVHGEKGHHGCEGTKGPLIYKKHFPVYIYIHIRMERTATLKMGVDALFQESSARVILQVAMVLKQNC